jgi:hypothetical protein
LGFDIPALAQLGATGLVLAWFMFRAERLFTALRLGDTRIEASVDRLGRAIVLHSIATANATQAPDAVKRAALALVAELDRADAERASGGKHSDPITGEEAS